MVLDRSLKAKIDSGNKRFAGYYQNRSCSRTYLLGYRPKTYLKMAQKCSKRASDRAKNKKSTQKQADSGQEQEVTIGLKERLSSLPLENWRLRFYGERLELWREDLTAPPSRPTGLRPRKLVQVFP